MFILSHEGGEEITVIIDLIMLTIISTFMSRSSLSFLRLLRKMTEAFSKVLKLSFLLKIKAKFDYVDLYSDPLSSIPNKGCT